MGSDTGPKLNISPECLKLRLPDVERLRHGTISVEAFVLSRPSVSPFVMVGDTLHAMTRTEYYALHGSRALGHDDAELALRTIVGLDEAAVDALEPEDAETAREIRLKSGSCPSCAYKRYRSQAVSIALRHGLVTEASQRPEIPPYPETSAPVTPVVSLLLSDIYRTAIPEHLPCLLCVEKHLSQAYVLGCESRLGYPAHISMMIGHLGEAIAETPRELSGLMRSIELCLAVTAFTREAFLPLDTILPLLHEAMEASRAAGQVAGSDDGSEMAVELDEECEKELDRAPFETLWGLERLSGVEIAPGTPDFGPKWVGLMASTADFASATCPKVANVIRNRRLMFFALPETAIEAGFGLDDVWRESFRRLQGLKEAKAAKNGDEAPKLAENGDK